LNKLIRFDTVHTAIQYFSAAISGRPYMGVGRNLSYTKDVFIRNKGLVSQYNIPYGDDDLFVNQHARKDNTQICIGEESLMYSIPKNAWHEFFVQKIRHLSVGKFYSGGNRFWLGLFTMSWLMSWLAGLPVLFILEMPYIVLGALVLRSILLSITVHNAARHLGHVFESWMVVVLDFIYTFYYLVTGLVALLSKKVRWKRN